MAFWEEEIDKSTRKIEIRFSSLFDLFHKQFHPLPIYRVDFNIKRTNFLILPEQFFNIVDVNVNEAGGVISISFSITLSSSSLYVIVEKLSWDWFCIKLP